MNPVYPLIALLSAFLTACSTQPTAAPDPTTPMIWQADFNDGSLAEWTGLIFEHGLRAQNTCSYTGDWAGEVTLSGDDSFVWRGRAHLNRSEFKYQPPAEMTQSGQQTFFGWSFYLPEAFSEGRHELGYWESEHSWQQMFRFNIIGTDFSFQSTQRAEPFWRKPGFAQPGVWRDVAMHIYWSTDPTQGFVEIWLDGRPQGRHHMQTLPNNEHAMFVQIGILRDRQERIERILIDNVRHGDSIEAVLSRFDPLRARTCQHVSNG